jgi:hypothetical protein
MSVPTRCLLDKVVVRYTLDGMLSLSLGRDLTDPQLAALQLFQSSANGQVDRFIAPTSANILYRLQKIGRANAIIQLFLRRTQIAKPTRYFTRWSRRLREFGFSPEDARMLALGTFSTNQDRRILGMHYFVTYDHPLMNLWSQKHGEIQKRLSAMSRQLGAPYDQAQLPEAQLLRLGKRTP